MNLLEHFSASSPLINHGDTESVISGLLRLEDGAIFFISCPILTSKREGPIMGSFVIGRLFDENKLAEFSEMTQYALTTYMFDSPDMPSDFVSAKSHLSVSKTFYIRPLRRIILLAMFYSATTMGSHPL